MRSLLKPAFITITLTLLGATLTGCNTLRGLGQDTERAGEAIQESATR